MPCMPEVHWWHPRFTGLAHWWHPRPFVHDWYNYGYHKSLIKRRKISCLAFCGRDFGESPKSIQSTSNSPYSLRVHPQLKQRFPQLTTSDIRIDETVIFSYISRKTSLNTSLLQVAAYGPKKTSQNDV